MMMSERESTHKTVLTNGYFRILTPFSFTCTYRGLFTSTSNLSVISWICCRGEELVLRRPNNFQASTCSLVVVRKAQ